MQSLRHARGMGQLLNGATMRKRNARLLHSQCILVKVLRKYCGFDTVMDRYALEKRFKTREKRKEKKEMTFVICK